MSVDVNRRGGAGGSTEPPKAAGSAADGGKGAGAGAGDGAGAGGDGATADSPASVAAGAGLAGARRSSAAGAARGVVGSETPVGEESKAVSSLAMRASVDGDASVIRSEATVVRSEARGVLSEASGSGESWFAAAADSAEASRTDSLPVPGKRPGGANRDVLPSWAGLIGREDSGNCSGVCRVAGRVGYRSIVAGGVATGDSGGLKPRSLKPWSLKPRSLRPRSLSLMARGGFASVPGWGWGKGPGSRRRSPSPTGTEAACDTTDGSVIPAERPRPIAQTRPKPVPAQTMAPSASGRLECL